MSRSRQRAGGRVPLSSAAAGPPGPLAPPPAAALPPRAALGSPEAACLPACGAAAAPGGRRGPGSEAGSEAGGRLMSTWLFCRRVSRIVFCRHSANAVSQVPTNHRAKLNTELESFSRQMPTVHAEPVSAGICTSLRKRTDPRGLWRGVCRGPRSAQRRQHGPGGDSGTCTWVLTAHLGTIPRPRGCGPGAGRGSPPGTGAFGTEGGEEPARRV